MKELIYRPPSSEADESAEPLYELESRQGDSVLHIYPRTFNEARPNGEKHRGVGSILGITEKLDWMDQLGVTAIWLGPIYESGGVDAGYDVSNYRVIDEQLGTIEDVEELIEQAHEHGIKVVFDLIPNHTSDQSEWFKASENPDHPDYHEYKDYYIWAGAKKGEMPENITGKDRLDGLPAGYTVPNNWSSIFSTPNIDDVKEQHGGTIPDDVDIPATTAWTWSTRRQQFYLAEFHKQQPSLDHSNPEVRKEIKDVMRFWFDKGIDSFRIDVMNHIGKDTTLADEDPAPVGTEIGQYDKGKTNPHDQWKQEKLVSHWPELGNYAQDLMAVVDEYENKRLILEDWMSALAHDSRLSRLNPRIANAFNFETLINTTRRSWVASNFRQLIHDYYSRMNRLDGAIPNQVTGNHDVDTIRSRLESTGAARAAEMMLGSLPGDLYVWQGDVLGRPNAKFDDSIKHRLHDADVGQRDPERIPMQWDASASSGFSQAGPDELWLPTVDSKYYQNDNVEVQNRYPESPLNFMKALLKRRKSDPALGRGGLRLLETDHPNVVAFARPDPTDPQRQVISLTNFGARSITVNILDAKHERGVVSLSSVHVLKNDPNPISLTGLHLGPDESVLIDSV